MKGKYASVFLIGVVMILGGLVLFFAFQDIETPVIGLRQVGAVIAVLGVVEVAVTGWSKVRSRD